MNKWKRCLPAVLCALAGLGPSERALAFTVISTFPITPTVTLQDVMPMVKEVLVKCELYAGTTKVASGTEAIKIDASFTGFTARKVPVMVSPLSGSVNVNPTDFTCELLLKDSSGQEKKPIHPTATVQAGQEHLQGVEGNGKRFIPIVKKSLKP